MNEIGKRITNKLIELHGSSNFTIGFLPYKRSMWNCMESVYQECRYAGAQAYILPLPYYLMPEMKIVSDEELFLNSFPIETLDEILFDYLVIHYPYDGNNKVTRMLPKYYTAELRNYGKVVYIPYSCTNMKQLRVNAGIANVDYAFLSTQAEASLFLEEWKDLGVDFTGRVFGLGSPKMDCIRKRSRGSATLVLNSLAPFLLDPYGRITLYQHHITNEIGRGRKVIFRPHPLLRQTIKSIMPQAIMRYEEFLGWCRSRDNVEVNESEYLEYVLDEADYLISDPSSVLEMWQATGREYQII